MSSSKQSFQTAVNKSLMREEREDAIDALVDADACERLAILVQMGGIDSPLRRRALNGMAEAECTGLLRVLTEKGGLEDSLRDDAEELLERL